MCFSSFQFREPLIKSHMSQTRPCDYPVFVINAVYGEFNQRFLIDQLWFCGTCHFNQCGSRLLCISYQLFKIKT